MSCYKKVNMNFLRTLLEQQNRKDLKSTAFKEVP